MSNKEGACKIFQQVRQCLLREEHLYFQVYDLSEETSKLLVESMLLTRCFVKVFAYG